MSDGLKTLLFDFSLIMSGIFLVIGVWCVVHHVSAYIQKAKVK